MPLLLSPDSVTDSQLEAILTEHRESIEELLPRLRNPAHPVRNAAGLRTGIELGEDTLELLTSSGAPGTPREVRRAIANVSYDAVVALVTLLKTSVDMPTVPQRKPPGTGTAPPGSP
jgi:hypothetical protein